MLDKLPAWSRHFILLLIVAVLTMVQDKLTGLDIPNELKPLVAAAITALLLAITPLTKQYGTFADDTAVDPVDPDTQAEVDELAADPLADPVSSQTTPGVPDTTNIPNREGDF